MNVSMYEFRILKKYKNEKEINKKEIELEWRI